VTPALGAIAPSQTTPWYFRVHDWWKIPRELSLAAASMWAEKRAELRLRRQSSRPAIGFLTVWSHSSVARIEAAVNRNSTAGRGHAVGHLVARFMWRGTTTLPIRQQRGYLEVGASRSLLLGRAIRGVPFSRTRRASSAPKSHRPMHPHGNSRGVEADSLVGSPPDALRSIPPESVGIFRPFPRFGAIGALAMSIVRLTVSLSDYSRTVREVANLNLSLCIFCWRFGYFLESPRLLHARILGEGANLNLSFADFLKSRYGAPETRLTSFSRTALAWSPRSDVVNWCGSRYASNQVNSFPLAARADITRSKISS
jgi:hypothetical protein